MYSDHLLCLITREVQKVFKCRELRVEWVDGLIQNNPDYNGIYLADRKLAKIRINGNILKMIETLCHEVIHHHQYKRGDLTKAIRKGLKGPEGIARSVPIIFWHGERYEYNHVFHLCYKDDGTSLTYHEWPWEEQAFRLQSTFFQHFCSKASRKLVEQLRDIAMGM